MRRTAGVLLISCLFASPLLAATADQSTGLLIVRHNDGSVDVENGAGQLVSRDQLKNGLSYRIRPNETVDISIDDPNPLLYTYEWKLGELKNSDNFDAISKFATAINPALGLLQTLTGVPRATADQLAEVGTGCEALSRAESSAICGAGVDIALVKRYATEYDDLLKFAERIPQWIKSSAGSKSAAEEVKKAVLEHPAAVNASKMAADIKKIKGARNAFTTALRTTASLGPPKPVLLASLHPETYMIASADTPQSSIGDGDLPAPGTSPGKPPTQQPGNGGGSQAVANQEEIEKLKARINELEAAADPSRADKLAAEGELIQIFPVILPTINDAEDTLVALDTFVGLVKEINEPYFLGTLPYNTRQVQPATLTIKPIPANASSVDSDVKTGEFGFSFQAFNPVNYYVDAGPVYSFIDAPEFGTEEVDGKHRIVRKDKGDEVNGASIGAMLTIVPRAWSDPTFGGGFQVAITPENDKLGFYVGAVLRLFDLVSLGGGVAYQQTQRLSPGLSVGQDLDTADALKTNTVFKAGPYISLSVKLR